MNITKEIDILRRNTNNCVLEIRFHFNGSIVKWFFKNQTNNSYLILICENENETFVKSYYISKKGSSLHIDGYMGKFMPYANNLLNKNSFGLSDFYKKTKEAIVAIEEPKSEFEIFFHEISPIEKFIRSKIAISPLTDKTIYFNHIRRTPITDKQHNKVIEILGKREADFLRNAGVTAVFTDDPTRQKELII